MSSTPIRKNAMPNSVNTPSASGPMTRRRIASTTTKTSDSSAMRHAGHREELQRHHREAGHEIEVEPDQPVEGILRLPGRALRVRHLDLDRMARERVAERRHERAHLDAAVDRVDDVAAVAAQHAALVGDPDLRRALADPVHHPRGGLAPPRHPGDARARCRRSRRPRPSRRGACRSPPAGSAGRRRA